MRAARAQRECDGASFQRAQLGPFPESTAQTVHADLEAQLGVEFRPDQETEHTADVLKDLSLRARPPISRYSKANGV
jgi:hypothetical protein